jgi:excisionase family DNA binding protein
MDEDEALTIPEVATLLGLNPSTPRSWVTSGLLPAHKDQSNRKWFVYRRDLDALLEEKPALGRPKGRGTVEQTTREDWSDAPEQATFDLVSSAKLPEGHR